MRRSYRFKAKLPPSAIRNAESQLALCCELYNAALQERRDAWRMCRKSVTRFDQIRQLPAVKAERPEFTTISSKVLADTVTRVARAFDGFFRRGGYPRFKPRARYDSLTFTVGTGWKLRGRKITMQGIGTARLFLSRPIEGRVKTVNLRRDRCGDWWVTFSCDDVPERPLPLTGESVGVDVGLASFLTLSDGTAVANPRHLRVAEAELKRTQRRVSKRTKGGTRRRKMVRTLARKHRRVQSARRDFAFKTALHLVRKYDHIAIENLNVRGLARSRLAKSVHDAGWSQFIECLYVKAESAGRAVTAVNPRGTSQVCSGCGCEPRERKTLAVRIHHCHECGLFLDRDENAARNILHLAERARAEPSGSSPRCKAAA